MVDRGTRVCSYNMFNLHLPNKPVTAFPTGCALSEDSDQPVRMRIRVFAVRLKTLGSFAAHYVPCEDSDQPPA